MTVDAAEGSQPSAARLGDLLQLLTELVQLDATAGRSDRLVAGAVLFDRLDESADWRNRVVLGVGVSPGGPDLQSFLRAAHDAGAAAVAIKPRGRALADIGRDADGFDPAVLVVRDDTDWGRLATLIRSSTLGARTDSVAGVRLGDTYALANAIAAIAGGATSIVDPVGRIVGYSTLSGQPIDDLRRATTLALQEVTPPAYDPDFSAVYAAEGAIRIPAVAAGELDRLAIAVRAGDELLATIWTIDPGGTTDVLGALDRLAPLAGLHLLHARSGADFGERRTADLMRTILDGAPHADFAAAQLGIDPAAGFAVAAFSPAHRDPGDLDAVRELQRLLNLVTISCSVRFASAHCALIDSRVYALFPLAGADPRAVHRRVAAEICESARTITAYPVRAAVGPVATSSDGLAASRSETLRMLELPAGAPRSVRADVALFEEFRARLGLQAVGGFLAPRRARDDADLERLKRHDTANQTDYLGTLAAFLRSSGSVTEVAERLHIHNNTARYRIGRLTGEFGLDLSDPDERLWLWLRLETDPDRAESPH